MNQSAATNPALYDIRNWDKYQSANCHKWIKDYSGREDDADFSRLTLFERGLLEGICRLRARTGKPLQIEHRYIAGALHIVPRDRSHLPHAIHTLTSQRFLIPCNQQDDFEEIDRGEERRGEERREEVVVEEKSRPVSQNQNLSDNEKQNLLADMRAIYEHHNVPATWNTIPAHESKAVTLADQHGRLPLLHAFDVWCYHDADDQLETKHFEYLKFPLRKFFGQAEHYVAQCQDAFEVKRRGKPDACPIVREASCLKSTENEHE